MVRQDEGEGKQPCADRAAQHSSLRSTGLTARLCMGTVELRPLLGKLAVALVQQLAQHGHLTLHGCQLACQRCLFSLQLLVLRLQRVHARLQAAASSSGLKAAACADGAGVPVALQVAVPAC